MDFSEPLWLQFVAHRKSAKFCILTKSLPWSPEQYPSSTTSTIQQIAEQSLAAEPGLGWTVVGFLSGHEYKVYDLI